MDFQSLHCFVRLDRNSDKIILPVSILEMLMTMEVQYPLTFEIVTNQKKTHCGVLEFTSDEGTCFIPQWIMNNLELKEGNMIYIRNIALSQATFIKFKPCLSFLEIYDPRAVLEYVLRSFSCVTIGDKLQIDYNFKTYILEVIEVLPKKACCIIESDIEVEFEEPDKYSASDKHEPDAPESPEAPEVQEMQNAQSMYATLPIPISGNEPTLNSSEISEPNKNKYEPTKWSKLSKIAHFQGKGNKTGN
jgi:ubiquitin fusion degradation protein 1